MKYRGVAHLKQLGHPVRETCNLLQVSPSGFYTGTSGKPSHRRQKNRECTIRVGNVFHKHKGAYAYPRIHKELQHQGVVIRCGTQFWDDYYKKFGHGYGANPPDPMCKWNFVIANYKTAGMQECNREALIRDFEDYIVYLKDLKEIGEITYESEVYSIPKRLYNTKGVFCFEHCSAIPYIRGFCHHWEDDHRKTRQNG